MKQSLTMSIPGLLLTVTLCVLGLIDLFFVVFKGTGSTISNFLVLAGFKAPVMVFAFGFLAGHLFGYMTLVPKE